MLGGNGAVMYFVPSIPTLLMTLVGGNTARLFATATPISVTSSGSSGSSFTSSSVDTLLGLIVLILIPIGACCMYAYCKYAKKENSEAYDVSAAAHDGWNRMRGHTIATADGV